MRSLAVVASLVVACAPAARPVVAPPPPPPDPPGLQLRPHAVNIVDARAAAETAAFLNEQGDGLPHGASVFYEHFDDAYDFLYVCSDGEVPATNAGRHAVVHRRNMEGTGLNALRVREYPARAQRLRSVVALRCGDLGNGPTLHETLHHWGIALSPALGVGREGDQNFSGHWGTVGVHGQEGGFDPATLRCVDPPDARPPACRPGPGGEIRVSVAPFSSFANGGDSVPYAPLELYLMGLVPRAEAGGPYLVLDGARLVDWPEGSRRQTWAITGTRTFTLDDVVRLHGARPLAAPGDRALRGAFVLFSAAPISAERMARLERWAAVFGDDVTDPRLLSFNRATGGRATMSTRLTPAR